MRVIFLWSRLSGYMSACWKSLSAHQNHAIKVIARNGISGDASDPQFDDTLLNGIDHELFQEFPTTEVLARVVNEFRPDVIVISGWFVPQYLSLVKQSLGGKIKIILCSDNPIQFTWRQRLAKWKIGWLLKHADLCVVPGERAFQLMKCWGVDDRKIRKGLYGVDTTALEKVAQARPLRAADWPGRFVFVGRFNRRKAVDVLLNAFALYRTMVADPWEMTVYGNGELEGLFQNQAGVVNCGFIQPDELPGALASASVFVLPSRHDAWPLAIVEACAAGMPVICTSACGSSAELVREEFNGLVIAPGDPASLSSAMKNLHHRRAEFFEMGRRSAVLASAYSPQLWSKKWASMFAELGSGNPEPTG